MPMDEEQMDRESDKEGDDGGNGGLAQGEGAGSQGERLWELERAWWRQSEKEEAESGFVVSGAESDLRWVGSAVRSQQELEKKFFSV